MITDENGRPITIPAISLKEELTEAPRVPVTVDDLDDWAIVSDGGDRWLGRDTKDPHGTRTVRLSPAYAYAAQTTMGQQPGQIGRQRLITPIELMASPNEVIVAYTSIVPLSSFDPIDRETFLAWIHDAEKMRTQIRASRVGLSLVSQMPPKGAVRQ